MVIPFIRRKKLKGKATAVKSKSDFAPAFFSRHAVPSISAYRLIVFAEQEEDSSLLCALDNGGGFEIQSKVDNVLNASLTTSTMPRVLIVTDKINLYGIRLSPTCL